MIRILINKTRLWRKGNRKADNNSDSHQYPEYPGEEESLSGDLGLSLNQVSGQLGSSPDVIIRHFKLNAKKEIPAAIIFIDGLVDKLVIDNHILRPLMGIAGKNTHPETLSTTETKELVQSELLTAGEFKCTHLVSKVIEGVLSGTAALLLEGIPEAILIDAKGGAKRGIEEPSSEVVVRGPKEGFTETIRDNMALLRRKLRTPGLTFENLKVGKQSQTDISIAYIKGVADIPLINEIRNRLQRIDTDAILDSGYIEQFIEDAPFSPFPTIANSERPDVVAAKILEGRAAILVDGTPFVLTVPMLFVESFQTPDDYNARFIYATVLRWIRYVAFAFSVLSPALYVALVTFHQELIPTPLFITMVSAREGRPFPAVVEAIVMGLIFELIREAGIRMPRSIGQAVSIVGALVIGQAVVSAGLVGAPLVIVIATTAIASFVVPIQANSGVLLRLILTVMAGVLGAFGIIIGLLGMLIHLASLRSFGVPYLYPITPLVLGDLKDVPVRAPLWAMFNRPKLFGWLNFQRQKYLLRPMPPRPGEQEENGTE
jgi:spore germination protein KA